ncbi:CatB-related O-acetyltransferase [Cellulophaga sp. HaHa_2_95]|uniref:CatB-related O-acetyltransferase n=1 Tax=unclassified Cellulophaga TaxID=2634405 RepID=UPI001C4E6DEF|nr:MULTISPECIES: CatB-related O-acetyltransferase [unclassified Cellulophaga]QXP50775.1 CatB-related O-acetyltransferase [Cellulophaga sp. HaHa_2_1]QXP56896.1 CatB-related O-acetyltransferase [Cellulophaga sp. HaHa_2_95]
MKIKKILLLVPGLIVKLKELAKDGSRDLENKFRYKDAIVEAGCKISPDTKIKSKARIFYNTSLNNCNISEFTYIGSSCFLQNTSVGKFCSVAKHSLIGLGIHPTDLISTTPLFYRKNNPLKVKLLKEDLGFEEYKPITIGHDVWIGARAIVMDGVEIGTGAIVASGAVVTKDIPPYAIVGGVPAKLIKYRFSEEKIEELLSSEWWEWDLEKINKYQKEKFANNDHFNNI